MNKKLVLIGGIEDEKKIYEEIISLNETNKKNFLYIGFGNNYSESHYEKIKKIFQYYGYNTLQIKYKSIKHDINIAKERIKNANIIYLDGGDTILFKEKIEESNLEKDLKEAYKNGCILTGVSAGAILLSKEGYSDSKILRNESNHHEFIKGFNFKDIIISPHYEKESIKTKELKEELKNSKKEVYVIPNDCLLVIENDKIKKIDKNKKEKITIIKG